MRLVIRSGTNLFSAEGNKAEVSAALGEFLVLIGAKPIERRATVMDTGADPKKKRRRLTPVEFAKLDKCIVERVPWTEVIAALDISESTYFKRRKLIMARPGARTPGLGAELDPFPSGAPSGV